MIKDKLLLLLKKNFPNKKFQIGMSPDPIFIFPAKGSNVGDLSIWDDSNEVTVSIGDITHGHFDSFNSSFTQDEIELDIAEQTIEFLKGMFADKYLLFKSQDGSGGWQHLDYIETPFKRKENTKYFVWSGVFDINSLK